MKSIRKVAKKVEVEKVEVETPVAVAVGIHSGCTFWEYVSSDMAHNPRRL